MTRARELALLAEPLPAEKALEWGLINRLLPDEQLQEEALSIAGRLADGAASLPMTRALFQDREAHEASWRARRQASNAPARRRISPKA